ncbi:hypothetical protein QBC35DRAFT_436096 [Podospora australis]|uniref:Uncharacterized protein n=1 Tax=Podospora australis TaxID=1536484 RepID=A0AAN7AII3_9PEZI|nr:hypothetical protein QBC35DRAFT_436096 [Podospora australis]
MLTEMEELDILILGAGWTATFLIPLLQDHELHFSATTTTGRIVAGNPTIPFRFEPTEENRPAINALPRARHVLITFPLQGAGPSKFFMEAYQASHPLRDQSKTVKFIQLGSTGIWQPGGPVAPAERGDDYPWYDRHSPYNRTLPRAVAEEELLSLGGCVLNLSGLWGGTRDPKTWVPKVAATKEAVRDKKSLHLIHGDDVARAVVAVVEGGDEKWQTHGKGQRYLLTDGFVYDWWSLLAGWSETDSGEDVEPTDQQKWVYELMVEEKVRALPRSMESLGRCYDSREFWASFGIAPLRARVG